jgi:hypothetical protein
MNFLTTAAFAALAIALVANADTAGKPSSSPENASSLSTGLSCFSAWEYIPLLRNGVVPFSETKDFHDTQFEYRPSGDVDIHYKAPEISLAYADPHSHRPFHKYTAHDVVIGSKLAHAVLKASDCERVSLIYWMK